MSLANGLTKALNNALERRAHGYRGNACQMMKICQISGIEIIQFRNETNMLRIMIQSMAATIAIVISMGCVTPYGIDRRRDVADIFTLSVGIGVGAKARIGPVETGLLADRGLAGLRGGTLFVTSLALPGEMEVNVLGIGFDSFMGPPNWQTVGARHKELSKSTRWFPISIWPVDSQNLNATQFTQIEVVAGAGPSLRVGFNPGEGLDSMLGWFGVDIYKDDLESAKAKGKTKKAPEKKASENPAP